METQRIRNFCIIAHIDHGKSTLADRLLEYTGALSPREMMEQVLDTMDLERERGITIKAHPVRLFYERKEDGQVYMLNLIDTPGHVDFSYEVSRSLAACEGALLLVDAAQGVEAQTVANAALALDMGLSIIPVINKIDLKNADPEGAKEQIEDLIGLSREEIILTSAKEGIGTEKVLEALVTRVPFPSSKATNPLRAMIFDSWFDPYQGVICVVRVFDGQLNKGDRIKLMSGGRVYEVQKLGVFTPKLLSGDSLLAGQVGFVICGIKVLSDTKIGDTMTLADRPATTPLPGFRLLKPMVFSGLYTIDAGDYQVLRDALGKLSLNDSSFSFEPDTSQALGFGFRCGFLGTLHMEIVQERLEREYNLGLITTSPSVLYRVTKTDGELVLVESPAKMPPAGQIEKIEEPFIRTSIILPDTYLGPVLKLCQERRGSQKAIRYLAQNKVIVDYELPLSEIVLDFYDRLKSLSRGYASMDYDPCGWKQADLVRLDILLNGELVDSMSFIAHRERAYSRGKELVEKLKQLIPRQLFEVAIQAAIGSRVIARETVKALRKNVTAKCYGGDISRKRKLLTKQKEGKKRMKQVGRVEIPQEAFLAVLKVS
ncbi:MAG: translation elongation factor 4 [Thermodesulfobacteriota bacterium]